MSEQRTAHHTNNYCEAIAHSFNMKRTLERTMNYRLPSLIESI